MNIMFLHPNFPAQYQHLARYFAHNGNHKVMFVTKNTNGNRMQNVNVAVYKPTREVTKGIHPYVTYLEEAVLDGQAVVRAMFELRQKYQYVPDVIIGHTGWGSTLYAKDVYPDVPLIGYFEWFYRAYGSDVGYWKDEKVSDDDRLRIRTQGAHHLLNLEACDVRYCPTEWQRQQFPERYQADMQVAHEGIDTSFYHPDSQTKLVLPQLKLDLSDAEEIVTYVSRGFEPYRGFPQFMEAVRILMKRRPKCHVVLVGNLDQTFYGAPPSKDKSWRQVELEKGGFDLKRLHFTGRLDYGSYLKVLQASTVHVYLTRPFVLSWSMLESMASGVCLVASATPPVEEVVTEGVNGLLANFRSPEHIESRIEEALEDRELRERLSRAARETVMERYDLKDCLRRQVNMIYAAMK